MFCHQIRSVSSIFFRIFAFAVFSATNVLAEGPSVLKNPYESIDWDRVSAYLANLHSHTIYSDGRAEPAELIQAYADAGYAILAITDHDNFYRNRSGERDPGLTPETSWPWTRWIYNQPSRIWHHAGEETAALYADLGAYGMLAIRGNELSSHPHIVSLFNDCGFSERNHVNREHDIERLDCVHNKDGIAIWAHPSGYLPPHRWQNRFGGSFERALDYYGEFLVRYDSLLGIEMNQTCVETRLEEATAFLDALLERYYREHDIFLFGNDDTHLRSVEDGAVLTIVMAEELTAESVRHALESGHTFVGQLSSSHPEFRSITVDESTKSIVLDIENADRVVWLKDGEEHAEGFVFNYADIVDAIVRFQVELGDVTFYSQAFHIGE